MIKNINVTTKDGFKLSATLYQPKTININSIVQINSGTGIRQEFYRNFACFLSERGITTLTFDYRGIGKSKPKSLNDFNAKMSDWGQKDMVSVFNWVIENYPNYKKIIIGHSLGGQLIAFSESSCLVDKILLIGSQSGYWKFWKGFSRYKMYIIWKFIFPFLNKTFGYLPSKKFSLMEDLPKGVTAEWCNWCLNPNYFLDCFNEKQLFFNTIKCSIYSYSSTDDYYAPCEAVDWLANKFEHAKVKRRHILPNSLGLKTIGHFGFFKNNSPIWNLFINDIKS